MRKILYLAVLTLACSCSKEKELENVNNPIDTGKFSKYTPVLKKLGYNTDLITDCGNSLLVEGDLRVSKHYLDSLTESPSFNTKQTMWSTAYLTRTAVSNITVYTNGSLSYDWILALQDAAAL